MSTEAVQVEEPSEAKSERLTLGPSEATDEPLRLSCGHLLSAVVTSPEGTSFCGACAELAEIVQAEAEAGEDDSEPAEDGQDTDEEPSEETVEASGDAEAEGAELLRQDGASDSLPQPFHSTRAAEPGPRGCWAISRRTGLPCAGPKRRDSDFCNAHAGIGVSADPHSFVPKAHEARKRNAETRATMRLLLGNHRSTGPRAALSAAAIAHSERLAGRAIHAALSPDVDDAKAAGIALSIIREAEPSRLATLTVESEIDPSTATLAELIAFAERHQIPIPGVEEPVVADEEPLVAEARRVDPERLKLRPQLPA